MGFLQLYELGTTCDPFTEEETEAGSGGAGLTPKHTSPRGHLHHSIWNGATWIHSLTYILIFINNYLILLIDSNVMFLLAQKDVGQCLFCAQS